MHLYVVIAALVLVSSIEAVTEEQQQRIDKISNECLPESHVEEEVLKQAVNGVFLDDPKLKVHALCVSKKIKMQDENGNIVEDVIRGRLNEQMKDHKEVDKVLKLCLVKKENPEETAFKGLECFVKNIPKDVVIY